MTNLLKTESLKLKKYKAFWWMTAIVALSYPGVNWAFFHVYKDILGNEKSGPIVRALGNPFAFPEAWHTVAYFSSWFVFIPAIIVIMFITNEYAYKTHRQNIIDGWSRSQFMIAKMIDVGIVSLLITIVYAIVSLVIGQVNAAEAKAGAWEQSYYIGLFFLQTFSQLSLAFLIAFLVRKAFIALGIFIFQYLILENFVTGYGKAKDIDVVRFLPFEISDRLIPYPKFLSAINQEAYAEAMADVNKHILFTVLLVGLTWGLCFWLNKNRDL